MKLSRRQGLALYVIFGLAAITLLFSSGGWDSVVFPFLVAAWVLLLVALAARRRALVVHTIVGLAMLGYLALAGAWGAIVVPFFLVAWLMVAAAIAGIGRAPRPARSAGWLLPAALPPLTFAVMVAFFLVLR